MKRGRNREDTGIDPSPVSRGRHSGSDVPRKSAKVAAETPTSTSKPHVSPKLDSTVSICEEEQMGKDGDNQRNALISIPPQSSKVSKPQNSDAVKDSGNDRRSHCNVDSQRRTTSMSLKDAQRVSTTSTNQQEVESKPLKTDHGTQVSSPASALSEIKMPNATEEQPKRVSLSHDELTQVAASNSTHDYSHGGVPYHHLLSRAMVSTGGPGAYPFPPNPYFAVGHPMMRAGGAIAGPTLQQAIPSSSSVSQFSQPETMNQDAALRVTNKSEDNQPSAIAGGASQRGHGQLSSDPRIQEKASELSSARYGSNIPLQYHIHPQQSQAARMYYDSIRIGQQEQLISSWHAHQIGGHWPSWAPPNHDMQTVLRSMLSRKLAVVSEHNTMLPQGLEDRSVSSQDPSTQSAQSVYNMNWQRTSVGNVEATGFTNAHLTAAPFDPRAASRTTGGTAGTSFSDGIYPAEEKSPASYMPKDMIPLSLPSDAENLSAYQCYVRQQINLFVAAKEEIECSAQGRNRPIMIGQVGIICRHCASIRPGSRSRGAVYFPAKLSGLYQAAQNMVINHFTNACRAMPGASRRMLLDLKEQKSSVLGGGKLYWANGARVLGVEEGDTGLILKQDRPKKDTVE